MPDMGVTEIAALALAGVSTAVQVAGTIAQGNAEASMESYKAAQANQAAGQARASAQRAAANQQRIAGFAVSKAAAMAGASGADPMSPSIVNDEQQLKGSGEFNALSELYTGEEKARGLEQGAATDIYQGQLDKQTAQTKAMSTIASSGSNMLMKYGSPFQSSTSTDYGSSVTGGVNQTATGYWNPEEEQ